MGIPFLPSMHRRLGRNPALCPGNDFNLKFRP